MKTLTLTPVLMLLAAAAPLQAAISYSGIKDLTISDTFTSLYVDFTDPLDASAVVTSSTEPGSWDINAFFGGTAFGSSDTFKVVTDDGTTNSTLQNLSQTVVVDGALSFVNSFSGSTDHMGSEFSNGIEGYFGFKIYDGVSNYYFGWMRVTFYDDGSTGILHDWAWDTSGAGIQVGAVPEPGSMGLLSLGAACLVLRRRRA